MPRFQSWASPERLEVAARLHGLAPAPADGARVLEIGCGAGRNLLPMAERLPGSRFVGVGVDDDVAEASAAAAAAGLGNVEVRGAVPDGAFDYVIVPGAYGRGDEGARDRLLEVVAARLAPAGVAGIGQWVTPGSRARTLVDEMLRWHLRAVADPAARAEGARSFLELAIRASRDLDKVYCAQLVDRLAGILEDPDELEHVVAGEAILDTCARLAARGLAFVGDADTATDLAALPGWLERAAPDALDREQYLDDVGNRGRRATVVCRADLSVEPRPSPARLHDLWLTAEGGTGPAPAAPHARAALERLAAARPAALSFAGLRAALAVDADALSAALLGLVAERRATAWVRPPPLAAGASDRPAATPLARRAAAAATTVVNLLHQETALDEPDRRVLALLDGERDPAALAAALGLDAGALSSSLQRLRDAALLTA